MPVQWGQLGATDSAAHLEHSSVTTGMAPADGMRVFGETAVSWILSV
jgi:hypothetical protein